MSKRKILVIDAAPAGDYAYASVACVTCEDNRFSVISHCHQQGKRAAEGVCLLLRQALRDAHWHAQHPPDCIAVIVGPGSFTGLRASCAAAEGYGLALDRPCIGLLRSDVLRPQLEACCAQQESRRGGDKQVQWAVISQARRGQIFVETKEGLSQVAEASFTLPDNERWVLAGERRFDFSSLGYVSDIQEPTPIQIARTALARFEGGGPFRAPRPCYVEPPRARLPKK